MIDEASLESLKELLARQQWVFWLMLAFGAIGVLQTTVFYRRTMGGILLMLRQLHRWTKILPENQASDWNKQMVRWYRKNYRSPRLRTVSLISSVGMLLTGIVGLLFLAFN